MTKMIAQGGRAMTPEEYAAEWSTASEEHKIASDYFWMSTFLTSPAALLELGCGSGRSTLELTKKNNKIVSIEVNEAIAEMAFTYLTNNDVSVRLLQSSEIDEIDLNSNIQVYIVQASIFDHEVESIVTTHKFDYVIFWLFGAAPIHAANELGVQVNDLETDFAAIYREKATKRSFELSQLNIANPSSLHIVLRSQLLSWSTNYSARLDVAEEQGNIIGLHYKLTRDHVKMRKNTVMMKKSSSAINYIHSNNPPEHIGLVPVFISILVPSH